MPHSTTITATGPLTFPSLITGEAYVDITSNGQGGNAGTQVGDAAHYGGSGGGFRRTIVSAAAVAGKQMDVVVGEVGVGGVLVSKVGKTGGNVSIRDSLTSGDLLFVLASGASSQPGQVSDYGGTAIIGYASNYTGGYGYGSSDGASAATISGPGNAGDGGAANPAGVGSDGPLPGDGGGWGLTQGGNGRVGQVVAIYRQYTKPTITGVSSPPKVGETATVNQGTIDDNFSNVNGGAAAILDFAGVVFGPTTNLADITTDLVDGESPFVIDIDRIGLYMFPAASWDSAQNFTYGDPLGPVVAGGTAPSFTSSNTFSVAENTTVVGTVTFDGDPTPTLSIIGGADQAKFTLVGASLRFITAPDFEVPTDANTDNVYVVQLGLDNDVDPNATQTVSVTVTNVVEASGYSPQIMRPWRPLGVRSGVGL